jgi:hypothetical protein
VLLAPSRAAAGVPCAPQLEAGALVGTEARSDVLKRHAHFDAWLSLL